MALRKIWCALFSCNTRFEICPFVLLRRNNVFQLISSLETESYFLPLT